MKFHKFILQVQTFLIFLVNDLSYKQYNLSINLFNFILVLYIIIIIIIIMVWIVSINGDFDYQKLMFVMLENI
jgi:hypothetical protein